MKKYLITVNQNQFEVEVVEVKHNTPRSSQMISSAPKHKTAVRSNNNNKETKTTLAGKKVTAPMPGNVIKVLVSEGDQVKKGQKLLVFEAMKMENDITSPCDGTVVEVKTSAGSVMAVGELLVVID